MVLLGPEVELLLLAGGLAEVSERAPATVPENCPGDRQNGLIDYSRRQNSVPIHRRTSFGESYLPPHSAGDIQKQCCGTGTGTVGTVTF